MSKILQGDCIEVMKTLPENSVDAIVTDPPYGLEFMGKEWDKFKVVTNEKMGGFTKKDTENWGEPFQQGLPRFSNQFKDRQWQDNFYMFSLNWAKEALRVLKPGGFLLSFGGTRTYHRMACAIEDAGFEIRDQIMWLYGCLSEDTEILTTDGWRNYKDIRKEQRVFSFNMLENKIEVVDIEKLYYYLHNGKMVNLKNDNTDQLLTLNHKVILKEMSRVQKDNKREYIKDNNWSWKYSADIKNYGYYRLPLGSIYDGYLNVGTDFAELLGWILSEGHYQKDTEAINIYQSSVNKEKVDMIRDLLDRMEIKYSEYKRKRKYKNKTYTEHQFYISGDIVYRIKSYIPDKKPSMELLHFKYNEKLALFNSLMLGDGSKKKGKEYTSFYQKDIKFLEWFQILCHLIGKQARINKKKWCVEVHHNPNTQLQARHLKNRVKNYYGIVWSIQTKNMSYIARRNGKIFITGNSGFPKSLNIGKQVDKIQGNKRELVGKMPWSNPKADNSIQASSYGIAGGMNRETPADRVILDKTKGTSKWEGWGTALKPANEPIVVARKPLSEKNVASNVLKWGTGGINIDGCRIGTETISTHNAPKGTFAGGELNRGSDTNYKYHQGRFPANVILDSEVYGEWTRFFYCAKASKSERNYGLDDFENKQKCWMSKDSRIRECVEPSKNMERFVSIAKNNHPTVKPIKLMRYLIRLVCPKGGIVLDPFIGSGTTAIACIQEGMNFIGIEKEEEYVKIAEARIKAHSKQKRLDKLCGNQN